MQAPLRNELLIIFGTERPPGELRHLVERLRQRGRVEEQITVLRCLDDLIVDNLVEVRRDALTDAKIYQATRELLGAFCEHAKTVEEAEIDARKTTPFAAASPDFGSYETVVVALESVERDEARQLQSLAKEVLVTDNATDLCDVAQAFARAMRDLRRAATGLDVEGWNRHPIARMWTDKISGLAGTQLEDLQPGDWLSIRAQVQRLAEGER